MNRSFIAFMSLCLIFSDIFSFPEISIDNALLKKTKETIRNHFRDKRKKYVAVGVSVIGISAIFYLLSNRYSSYKKIKNDDKNRNKSTIDEVDESKINYNTFHKVPSNVHDDDTGRQLEDSIPWLYRWWYRKS